MRDRDGNPYAAPSFGRAPPGGYGNVREYSDGARYGYELSVLFLA